MLPSHISCFMHSYYSMHLLCLYLHLLFIHAFALLILSTCLRLLVLSIFCSLLILFCSLFTSYHHIISSNILCILEHQLLIFPSSHISFSLALSTLLFSWVFFSSDSHSFHHFNVQLCHPPPLHFTTTFLYFSHCYNLLLLLSIFQIISDFFSLIFLNPHFLSPSFYIFGATYVWPFSVILWLIFLDFCTLQYLTILHLIYDAKYVYISSLFLECVGNNCLYIVFDIKHLLVFLAPNITFIGQMEKDIGRGVSRVQYLSTADQ